MYSAPMMPSVSHRFDTKSAISIRATAVKSLICRLLVKRRAFSDMVGRRDAMSDPTKSSIAEPKIGFCIAA